jgi:hypothetical protein
MPDSPRNPSIVPSEVQPTACSLCGGSDALEIRPWRGEDAGLTKLWYAVCRACVRDDIRAGAAAQAAHWRLIGEDPAAASNRDAAAMAEQVRLVAQGLRELLAKEGVEPDEATAQFIARYAAA